MKSQALHFICFFVIILTSCNPNNSKQKTPAKPTAIQYQTSKDTSPNSLFGTWISTRPNAFQIVEILDSSTATVSRFEKWRSSTDNKKDNIAYYKYNGKLVITDKWNIQIHTKQFKFYYSLLKDTMYEIAEPGRVDTLIKVYTDSVYSVKR